MPNSPTAPAARLGLGCLGIIPLRKNMILQCAWLGPARVPFLTPFWGRVPKIEDLEDLVLLGYLPIILENLQKPRENGSGFWKEG